VSESNAASGKARCALLIAMKSTTGKEGITHRPTHQCTGIIEESSGDKLQMKHVDGMEWSDGCGLILEMCSFSTG